MTNENTESGFAGSCFICNSDHADHDHDRDDDQSRGYTRRSVLRTAALAPIAAAGAATLAAPRPARAQTFRQSGEYVIEAGWVLAYQNDELTLLRDASILVRNDRIEDVREGPIPGALTRIPMPEQLVVPGFISGHTHACSATPTRGIIEGGRSFARPLSLVEDLSDDELDDLTAFNVYELLRGGSTTHVEMSLSLRQAESYVRIAKKWGVRGYPGGMIPGIARLFPVWFRPDDKVLFDSVPETLKEIEDNLAFGRANNGAADGRILPMMAPHATDTHTPETFAAILAGAKELGNGIHIHLAQSGGETATVQKLWGVTPVQWLEKLGLLDVPLFGAHMNGIVWETDPEILNRHGTVYAHCPSGLGAGGQTQQYPEALGAGMNVNIGIDTHSNDYLENLKLAVVYGRERYRLLKDTLKLPMRNPTIWPAIEGATLVAAKGLRRTDIGRIAPGAKADLTTIDVTGPLVGTGALPPEPLNNLLYAHGLSVRNVVTDGMFQIVDGELVVDDPIQVAQAGGRAVQKIWDQLAAEDWFKPTER